MITLNEWDEFLADKPDAHVLQMSAWGKLKSSFGWYPRWVISGGCGAQVLFRRLPLGLTVAYLPKGPVGIGWKKLLPELHQLCRKERAIFLKIEPDFWEEDVLEDEGIFSEFKPSNPIQPRRTVNISLAGNEEEWLSRMGQKTRYNIRLAGRKEVVVRECEDVEVFHRLMETTGTRDGFGVHSLDYYRQALSLFVPTGNAALLIAYYQDQPLAGLIAFARGRRSWYLYGASSDAERNRMPTYLLQWEAMRWAASKGCQEYDLWGVPDENAETLESQFESRSDGLWGVYRFKRGFGGELKRAMSAYDYVYLPLLYQAYRWYTRREEN